MRRDRGGGSAARVVPHPGKNSGKHGIILLRPGRGSLDAEFDLSISRSLLAQDKLDGTIRVGDREYVVWTWPKYGFLKVYCANFRGR